MCGIAGILDPSEGETLRPRVEEMVRTLKHRGPDGTGVWVEKGVALGHTRLAVIDLTDEGRQPMASCEGKLQVVFNGEIYNFLEIRKDLEARGVSFRSRSDTEVILKLYEAEGAEGLERLDGMFAVALWDARIRRLFLLRDRAGKKPLYYVRRGGVLLFASEIKALLAALPDVPPLVPERIPQYLFFGYVPTPDTLYEGIRRLPPGSMAVVDPDRPGDLEPKPFWSLRYPPAGAPFRESREEARGKLRDLLREAVRRRLISDVPLGAFLSGGIDSTIVVGLMSTLMKDPVRTFSIGFRNSPDFDETSYARLAARRFGTQHTEFKVEPRAFDLVQRLLYHHDEPFADSSAIPTYIVSRLAREHVTVVLNGDGGDELFAGYLRFPASLFGGRLPRWLRSAGPRIARHVPGLLARMKWVQRGRRFLEKLGEDPIGQFVLRNGVVATETLGLLVREGLREAASGRRVGEAFLGELPEGFGGWTPLSRMLYLNFARYLHDDLLPKMDRMTMAHGLEARSPLLDTAVVEYAASLPDSFKLKGFKTKVLLKEAFADLLPEAIQTRGKMGFGVPLRDWFRGELRAPVEDLLVTESGRVWDYLNRPAGLSILKQHLEGTHDHALILWGLLVLELWLRSARRPSPPTGGA